MAHTVFISHVYEDRDAASLIRAWAASGQLGLGVEVIGETEDVRQGGPAAIREHLSPKIKQAMTLIVLIGNDTHNHHWVEYEASHALSERKRVILVRIVGTTGLPPPSVAKRATIAMTPLDIARALVSP